MTSTVHVQSIQNSSSKPLNVKTIFINQKKKKNKTQYCHQTSYLNIMFKKFTCKLNFFQVHADITWVIKIKMWVIKM